MVKVSRNVYSIKTSPYNDNEKLENLLNEMSKNGWELYSMQEIENDEGLYYNCIFVQEVQNDEDDLYTDSGLLDFRPRIERIISPELEPYDLCCDILKKVKEKRQKIAQVKLLIDGTSEDSRALLNEEISKHINELDDLKKKLLKVINPDIMESKLGAAKLTLAVSEELAPLLDSSSDDNLLSQIVYVRQNLTEKSGYIIPKIKLEIDDTLEENEFSIKVRGIPAVNSYAYCGYTMFNENELKLEKLPDESAVSEDKITNSKTVWIGNDTAKDYWVKGLSASEYISDLIEYTVIKYIEDIFDYSDIERYIEITNNQNPYLIENIIPDYLSIAELKYILISLIQEKVSIKDIIYIFEKINDYSYEEEKEDLLSNIRISLKRQISASISEKDNIIKAYELSAEFLKVFSGAKNSSREVISIERSKAELCVKKILQTLSEMPADKKEIILAAPFELRHAVYLVLSKFIPNIRVIAYEEISPEYKLEICGKI